MSCSPKLYKRVPSKAGLSLKKCNCNCAYCTGAKGTEQYFALDHGQCAHVYTSCTQADISVGKLALANTIELFLSLR